MASKTGFNISEPFETAAGNSAEAVGEFGRYIGVVMTAEWGEGWEAWPNYPYGPFTKHDSRVEAIRTLRTEARKS